MGILRTWRQRVESSFQAMFFPRLVFTGRIWIADCIDDYSDDSAPVCYNSSWKIDLLRQQELNCKQVPEAEMSRDVAECERFFKIFRPNESK